MLYYLSVPYVVLLNVPLQFYSLTRFNLIAMIFPALLLCLCAISGATSAALPQKDTRQCWRRGHCQSESVLSVSVKTRLECWKTLKATEDARFLTYDTKSGLCILSEDCGEVDPLDSECETCRTSHKSCDSRALNGRVLVATGAELNEAAFEVVDLNSKSSCPVENHKLNLEGAMGGLLGGEPYICGGFNTDTWTESNKCYKYASGTGCEDWVDAEMLVMPTSYAAMAPLYNPATAPFGGEDWLIVGDRDGVTTEKYGKRDRQSMRKSGIKTHLFIGDQLAVVSSQAPTSPSTFAALVWSQSPRAKYSSSAESQTENFRPSECGSTIKLSVISSRRFVVQEKVLFLREKIRCQYFCTERHDGGRTGLS